MKNVILRIAVYLLISLGFLTLASRATTLQLLWEVDLGRPTGYPTIKAYGRDGALMIYGFGNNELVWISSSGKILGRVPYIGHVTAVSNTGLVTSGGRTTADGSQASESQSVISYYNVEIEQVRRLDWIVDGKDIDFSGCVNGGLPIKSLGSLAPAPYILIASGQFLKCYTLNGSVFDTFAAQPTLQSPVLTNGVFQFTAAGIAGDYLSIDGSTNMTQWSVIKTIENPKPSEVIQVPTNGDPDRFRARSN